MRILHSRLTKRIFKIANFKFAFKFALLAALVAGTVPFLATAQQAASSPTEKAATDQSVTTQSATAPQGGTQGGLAKQEEKKEDDVYRHTPLVESVAKVLHLEVETTARLLEFINFAIIALVIGIPLVRILPKVLHTRRQTLSQNLEVARKTTQDANSRLSAVEAQLSRLDEEIAKIRAQVEDESKQDEVRIKATIEEESARIVAAAEQEIGAAAAQARRGLRHFAADLAIEQAARTLDLTPEIDRALIAEFVSSVSAEETHGGGQN